MKYIVIFLVFWLLISCSDTANTSNESIVQETIEQNSIIPEVISTQEDIILDEWRNELEAEIDALVGDDSIENIIPEKVEVVEAQYIEPKEEAPVTNEEAEEQVEVQATTPPERAKKTGSSGY